MNDEFLLRVDEELPSDERTAVKVIETRVLSEDYRSKLEAVIEKLEGISAINNVDVLRDMKDILSGLLDSITAINSKYSFLSEMILKLDEKSPHMNEKIDRLSAGIADILADIQTSMADLAAKDVPEVKQDPLLADSMLRLEEKMNEISVINAELGEKIENMSGEYHGALDSIEEKLGDLSVSNASMIEKMESVTEIGEKVESLSSRVEDRMGEVSVSVAALEEKVSDIHEMAAAVESLKSSVAGLESRSDVVGDLTLKMDEKMSELPVLKEVIDGLEEKMNNISVANSELLGNISDSIRNIESRHDAMSDTFSRLDEKMIGMVPVMQLFARLEEKMDGMDARISELGRPVEIDTTDLTASLEALNDRVKDVHSMAESLNDKINDALIQNKELSDKLDQMPASDGETMEGLKSEMNSAERKIAAALESISDEMMEKIDKRIQLSSEETHRLRREMEDLESRLKKQSDEILAAISTLRPKAVRKKRKTAPRKNRKKSTRRRRARRATRRVPRVNNETLDILIVNTLNAASMSIAQLRETTKIGEKKLRERLDALMVRGVVVREKRGRSVFYVSQAQQSMPTG
ncbi:MAG: hypothetical protein J4400_04210 [Candidatus Aenigmarchaeota archaeon]|nr:hypothetical protein [Candidatus Aenigmarchaeota archaeon]